MQAHRLTRSVTLFIGLLTMATVIDAASVQAATGDAAAGQHVFVRCAQCHSAVAGVNGTGPSLAGVYGRQSGAAPGYNYSPALKRAKLAWDDATLDKFLQAPNSLVHGTKMYVNVAAAKDRQDVIAYLKTLAPSSPSKSQ